MKKLIATLAIILSITAMSSANAGWKSWFGSEETTTETATEASTDTSTDASKPCPYAEKRFEMIDTNNDGMISKEEFMAKKSKWKDGKHKGCGCGKCNKEKNSDCGCKKHKSCKK